MVDYETFADRSGTDEKVEITPEMKERAKRLSQGEFTDPGEAALDSLEVRAELRDRSLGTGD